MFAGRQGISAAIAGRETPREIRAKGFEIGMEAKAKGMYGRLLN